MVYKCRYTAKPYLTLSADERTELKLEAPVRNVLGNQVCYYNDIWYTVTNRYDDGERLDLRSVAGTGILKDIRIEDVKFR